VLSNTDEGRGPTAFADVLLRTTEYLSRDCDFHIIHCHFGCIFFFYPLRPDRLWRTPNLLSNGYLGLSPEVTLTTHPYLVFRSRMSRRRTSSPPKLRHGVHRTALLYFVCVPFMQFINTSTWGISVGIVSDYRLDEEGSIFSRGKGCYLYLLCPDQF
jgi:hypothetical protein